MLNRARGLLALDTIPSPELVRDDLRRAESALVMLGVRKPWSNLAAELAPSTAADLKLWLNGLSHRRNKIAHEGDLLREARPQRVKHEVITSADGAADLDGVEVFIKALDTVISN